MTWVAVAVGGATLLSGVLSSNSASNAANTAAGASDRANALTQAQYDQNRKDAEPWRRAGGAAMNQLGYLLGLPGYAWSPNATSNWGGTGGQTTGGPTTSAGVNLAQAMATPQFWTDGGYQQIALNDLIAAENGNQTALTQGGSGGAPGATSDQWAPNTGMGGYGSLTTPFSQTNWQADPGYAFRLAEGQKALERSASARGMTLSGAQQKALLNYGQGMGAQEYQAAYGRYNNDQTTLFNRLSGIAGSGQQSNQYMAGLGAQNAALQGQNTMGAATTAANAGLYSAGQWGNALNTGANLWMQYVNGQQNAANRIG